MTKSNSGWANLAKEHALFKFAAELPAIIADVGYSEMYGVELQAPTEGQAHINHGLERWTTDCRKASHLCTPLSSSYRSSSAPT